MPDTPTLDDRVAALESELAALKRRLDPNCGAGRSWLDRVAGSFRDEPEFDEVLRLAREYRQSHQTDADA